ncbi:unnamed protein product [Camellia sinensis]
MENSVPAITFLLAAIFSVEQVHLNRRDGIAKVIGTLSYDEAKNWAVGCVCLIGHCLAWASRIVLQGPIVKKYPAQFSLASHTCFFGLVQFLAIAAFLERDLQAWQIHSTTLYYKGSIIGAVFVIAGLYLVVWGRSAESKFAAEKAGSG